MPKIHYTRFHGEVASLLPTCRQQVVVMEFGKRHDTTDTTDFCRRQLVTDLLVATGKLVQIAMDFSHQI